MIVKIKHSPRYRVSIVKKMPKDCKYVQQTMEDEELYYSKIKEAYYTVKK